MKRKNEEILIPPAAIKWLIDAGRLFREKSYGRAALLLAKVQPHDRINRLGWQTWDAVLEGMNDEDVDALARGLAVADSLPGWGAGSVAAIIWVFRGLERRGFPKLRELAEWISDHDSNSYAPFGTSAHKEERMQSLRGRERAAAIRVQANENESRLRRIMGTSQYDDAHAAWLSSTFGKVSATKDMLGKQLEATKRISVLEKDLHSTREELLVLQARLIHFEMDLKHSALLRDGAGLSPAGRLNLVANRSSIPLAMFPEEWASSDHNVLAELDSKGRQTLMRRLADRKKGPWQKVYKALAGLSNE